MFNLIPPIINSNPFPHFKLDNVLSEEDIKQLDEYTKTEMPLEPAQYITDDEGDFKKEIRSTDISWIDTRRFPDIYQKLGDAVHYANNTLYKYAITYLEPCQYSVYSGDKKGHYVTHCDSALKGQNNDTRKISFSLLLNDPKEFEGGKLMLDVDYKGIDCDLQYNQICFFPSFLPHKVTPVTKGTRRSLVGWVHGPDFV